jgi:hypothetical protein
VRAWVTAQVASGLHVNTVRKHLHAVKPFFKWCWQQRIIDADRYMRIARGPPPRGSTSNARPRPYKRKEVERFWTELDARWPTDDRAVHLALERGLSRWPPGVAARDEPADAGGHVAGAVRRAAPRRDPLGGAMDDIHPDNEFIVVRGKSRSVSARATARSPTPSRAARWSDGGWSSASSDRPPHDSPWLVLTPTATPNSPDPEPPVQPDQPRTASRA